MAHVEWHEKKGGRDDGIATSGVPTPRNATTFLIHDAQSITRIPQMHLT